MARPFVWPSGYLLAMDLQNEIKDLIDRNAKLQSELTDEKDKVKYYRDFTVQLLAKQAIESLTKDVSI